MLLVMLLQDVAAIHHSKRLDLNRHQQLWQDTVLGLSQRGELDDRAKALLKQLRLGMVDDV
jgi:hypothetical protein